MIGTLAFFRVPKSSNLMSLSSPNFKICDGTFDGTMTRDFKNVSSTVTTG